MNTEGQYTATPRYNLKCRMAYESAALERLCQVIRIRGFRVTGMAVAGVGDQLDIQLTLEGTRSIDMLKSQLEKLHTVVQVALPHGPEAPGEWERTTLASA